MRGFHTAALAGLTAAAATGGALLVPVSTSAQQHRAAPPAVRFSHPQPNPYFPLEPGTVFRYRGTDDGQKLSEVVTVTHRKKMVAGVQTTVVRDVLRRADGSLAEKTHDWYAADNHGRVWYFGERTATYDRHGMLRSREGSWHAGVGGAVAGTIMPATPHATQAYRQEYWRGRAEDQAWVVRRGGAITVPYGRVRDLVRTYEWSRLEPRVVSVKIYGPGLGIVQEHDVAGGTESFALVAVQRP
jgi:hypothetical protein